MEHRQVSEVTEYLLILGEEQIGTQVTGTLRVRTHRPNGPARLGSAPVGGPNWSQVARCVLTVSTSWPSSEPIDNVESVLAVRRRIS